MKKQRSDELHETPDVTTKTPVATGEKPLKAVEYGGQKGPEPTRYGDWEKAGRCTDF